MAAKPWLGKLPSHPEMSNKKGRLAHWVAFSSIRDTYSDNMRLVKRYKLQKTLCQDFFSFLRKSYYCHIFPLLHHQWRPRRKSNSPSKIWSLARRLGTFGAGILFFGIIQCFYGAPVTPAKKSYTVPRRSFQAEIHSRNQ